MLTYDRCLVVPASHLDTDTLACQEKNREAKEEGSKESLNQLQEYKVKVLGKTE